MEAFIFQQINGLALRYLWLDIVGIFLAKYLAYFLGAVLFLFLLYDFKKYWRMAVTAIVAAIFSRLVLVEFIRIFIGRSRPFLQDYTHILLTHSSLASFPSGHASVFFAVSAAVFFFNRGAGIVFFSASCIMGLARIFVGLHWPGDILTGMLLGIFSGLLGYKIFEKYCFPSSKML